MSAVFGMFRFAEGEVARRDLDRMGTAMRYRGADRVACEALGPAGLGHCLARVNRQDRFEAQPLFDDALDLALVADCRIDNRDALAAEFGWDVASLAQWPDSAFVLEACRRWGEAAPEHLLGDFVFALWNGRTRELLLARDPMGQRYCHYHHGAAGFVFATDLAGLWPLETVPRRPSRAAIARMLFGDDETGRGATCYEGIAALPGGTVLVVDATGAVRHREYWIPRPAPEHIGQGEDYYARTYRALLSAAVTCRVDRLLDPPALALSGGVDSGAVAALAGPPLACAGQRLIGVTCVSATPGKRRDARAAAEACAAALPHVELHCIARSDETALDGLEQQFAQRGLPHAVDYVTNAIVAEARAGGARLILDGAGGDYTLNFRGPLDWRPLLRRGAWRRAWRETAAVARASGRWNWGALLGHALPRFLPDRLLRAVQAAGRGFVPQWRHGMIAPELARRMIAEGAADATRMRSLAGLRGRAWMRAVMDVQRRDTPAGMAVAAGAAGLQLSRPFLDRRIVEFALAIPEDLYFRDGAYRPLARAALSGLLPPALLAHRPNDAIEPDFVEMRSAVVAPALAEVAALETDDALNGLIDFAKLRSVLEQAAADSATQSDASRHALHALAAARFIAWHNRRNSAQPAAPPR